MNWVFFIKSCKSTSNQSKIKLFWSFSKNCDVSVVSRSVVSALCWDWYETRKGEYENFNYKKNGNWTWSWSISSILFYTIHINIYPIYFIPYFLYGPLASTFSPQEYLRYSIVRWTRTWTSGGKGKQDWLPALTWNPTGDV